MKLFFAMNFSSICVNCYLGVKEQRKKLLRRTTNGTKPQISVREFRKRYATFRMKKSRNRAMVHMEKVPAKSTLHFDREHRKRFRNWF